MLLRRSFSSRIPTMLGVYAIFPEIYFQDPDNAWRICDVLEQQFRVLRYTGSIWTPSLTTL
jgi:hypothetical protein